MSINKFNAKNGLSVGSTPISVIDNAANANFLSVAISAALIVPVGTDATRPTPEKGMIRYSDTWENFEGYNGLTWGTIGGQSLYTKLTSNTTIQNGARILADTATGSFNIQLPNGVEGNTIEIWDYSGNWETNVLTLLPASGENINNLAENLVLDMNNVRVSLIYTNDTKGWQVDVGGINGWSIISGAASGGGGTSVSVSADNSTNAAFYPMLSQVTSGTLSTTNVSNEKLSFNPSTGILSTTSLTTGVVSGTELYASSGFRFADGTLQTTAASGSGGGGGSAAVSGTDETSSATVIYPMLADGVGALTSFHISTTKLSYTPSGGILYATVFNSSSDERLKNNIQPINDALYITEQLQGKSFNWNETGQKSYGFIAQELEQILPELVTTTSEGFKSVNYDATIAILLESIKELNKRIKLLETK